MEAAKRIIVNTVVQYIRSFVYMVLMLFTTRYILAALGHSDYGIYSVIGSVVFLLGFITNSLAGGTQRFLSYSQGLENKSVLKTIFANTFALHAGVAVLLIVIMTILEPWIMGYLTIPDERIPAGTFVYFMVLLMVLLSFVTAPVRALFIARENIVYVSVVEILDAVLKLIGALALPYIMYDSLKLYAVLMLMVQVFNFLAYTLFAAARYEECRFPSCSDIKWEQMKKLTDFAVWNIYAVGSTVVRTQGLAVVINHFVGTVVNAAYGLALQVSNAVGFIALSILNSMNPQLMSAEGAGNRARMLMLCRKESKYSFLALALLLVPLIIEMPEVLHFWLGNPPEYTCMFSRFILVDFILDQLTIGLTSANQAIGRIRNYSLLTSTVRLCVIPAAWICLDMGLSPFWVMACFIGVNIVIWIIRLPFLKFTAGLEIMPYLSDTLFRNVIPVIGIILTSILVCRFIDCPYRFVLTECCSVLVGGMLIYAFSLSGDERMWILSKIRN